MSPALCATWDTGAGWHLQKRSLKEAPSLSLGDQEMLRQNGGPWALHTGEGQVWVAAKMWPAIP